MMKRYIVVDIFNVKIERNEEEQRELNRYSFEKAGIKKITNETLFESDDLNEARYFASDYAKDNKTVCSVEDTESRGLLGFGNLTVLETNGSFSQFYVNLYI